MCGATDCPSCGPAQGYEVVRVARPGGGWAYVNPEEETPPKPLDIDDMAQIINDLLDHEGAEGFSEGLRERARQMIDELPSWRRADA